jgi:hypothetical protein
MPLLRIAPRGLSANRWLIGAGWRVMANGLGCKRRQGQTAAIVAGAAALANKIRRILTS